MAELSSYDDCVKFLITRDRPVPRKKAANNTYVERRDADTIAVRLHDTDVVTYHADGRITLDTGEWYTVTTKERINRFTPANIHIASNRGRWIVAHHVIAYDNYYTAPDWTDTVPFADGMELREGEDARWHPTEVIDTAAEDAHNASVRRLLDKWLRTVAEVTDDIEPDNCEGEYSECPLCIPLYAGPIHPKLDRPLYRLAGDGLDTQHLIEHLTEGRLPGGLLMAALSESGCHIVYWFDRKFGGSMHKRALRRAITRRLYRGAVANQNGRRPLDATPHTHY